MEGVLYLSPLRPRASRLNSTSRGTEPLEALRAACRALHASRAAAGTHPCSPASPRCSPFVSVVFDRHGRRWRPIIDFVTDGVWDCDASCSAEDCCRVCNALFGGDVRGGLGDGWMHPSRLDSTRPVTDTRPRPSLPRAGLSPLLVELSSCRLLSSPVSTFYHFLREHLRQNVETLLTPDHAPASTPCHHHTGWGRVPTSPSWH